MSRGAYVEAPNEWHGDGPSIFFAGGITGCPDWQSWARHRVSANNITSLNPRRADFPIGDPSAARAQIEWEHRHLHAATVILFWFAAEQIQPIALYELGAWSMTGKPIVVGAHPDYARRQDVVIQTQLVRPSVTVRDSLAATVTDAAMTVERCLEHVGASGL